MTMRHQRPTVREKMKSLRNALLCLAVLQLSPAIIQSSDGHVASCCLKTSTTTLPREKIKDYYNQKSGICPVDAVIFVTMKGKRICSDPANLWVNKTMKYVDGKKARLRTAIPSLHLSTKTSAIMWNMTNTTSQTF
ncbi:hypothetical protein AAFF_G00039330 [Aldrovandia affinis]|uniref:C-C motif chemokine n=1 Tax=Aldrovandia affinis TaxID=143900 RepID=A0AAD7S2X8_9TELE|nr:hypothetical protein AAFF_G00039330 [Aldrovandia affinis]